MHKFNLFYKKYIYKTTKIWYNIPEDDYILGYIIFWEETK